MRIKLTALLLGFTLTIFGQTDFDFFLTDKDEENDFLSSVIGDISSHLLHEDIQTEDNDLPESIVPETVFSVDSVYAGRLRSLSADVELCVNPLVTAYIERYTGRGKKQVSKLLKEGEYYFPLFDEILKEEGIPNELKYLSVIESAINPLARSRMGAVGLWQFMPKTARAYGLEVGTVVDERCDPVKSTRAAAKYLKYLYDMYDDWHLALAAYNCGFGNVNKAIRRAGGEKDFFAIFPYLPKETRNFVPSFIAAVYAMNFYEEHGIYAAESDWYSNVSSLTIDKNIRFSQIANILNISLEELRKYNPQFRNNFIPGNKKEYKLSVPSHYISNLAENKRTQFFNLTKFTEDIFFAHTEENPSSKVDDKPTEYNSRPVEIAEQRPVAVGRYSNVQQARTVLSYHDVQQGETLYQIAKKNDVTIEELKYWNNLASNTLKAGSQLEIRKIEYVDYYEIMRESLKEPELMAIYPDIESSRNIMQSYLENYQAENESVQYAIDDEINLHLKLLATANEFEYKTITLPAKNKDVKRKLTTTANVALGKVKDWSGNLSDKINFKKPSVTLVADKDAQWKEELAMSFMPEPEPTAADIASNDENLLKVYHKVKIGETLTRIAAYYNVSKDDILAWNEMDKSYVKIRQRLLIFVPKNEQLAHYKIPYN